MKYASIGRGWLGGQNVFAMMLKTIVPVRGLCHMRKFDDDIMFNAPSLSHS